jgi:NADH-quinone oxidoreductase subunit J
VVDWIVFVAGAVITLAGAVGVVTGRNPVHSALLLVMTLFGIAVLFVSQEAHFLAAVQVIVYAGAVVVLFLFVIMLLGVDRTENLRDEPLKGQRPAAAIIAILGLAELVLLTRWHFVLGAPKSSASGPGTNVEKVGEAVFTRYLFPFEVTSVLLVIAVVGAVALSRRPRPLTDALPDGSPNEGVRA